MTTALVHYGGRVDLMLSTSECRAYHISPAFADVPPLAWYESGFLVSRLLKTHGLDVLNDKSVIHHIVYAVEKIAKKQRNSRVAYRFFVLVGQFYQQANVKRTIMRQFDQQLTVALLKDQKEHLMKVQALQAHIALITERSRQNDKVALAAIDHAVARAVVPNVANMPINLTSPEPPITNHHCMDMDIDSVPLKATSTVHQHCVSYEP